MSIVEITDLAGEATTHKAEHVNFINPATHGDPRFLFDRADYDEDSDVLFVNAAAVLHIRIKD